jgi:hypothetical protein
MNATEGLLLLKAPPILVAAAREGRITTLECAMPECVCPDGRGHFVATNRSRGPWIPTPDRWPRPARDGGAYVTDNVRLAHARCNYVEGNRVGVERAHATGWYGSECQRELSRRNMRAMLEGWGRSPEAAVARHRSGVTGGRARSPEGAVRAGKAGHPGLLRWQATEEGHAQSVENGRRLGRLNADGHTSRIALCQRWNLNRGKSCVCGRHAGIA